MATKSKTKAFRAAFFVHTAKAVRHGNSADLVYVAVEPPLDGKYLAWKFHKVRGGIGFYVTTPKGPTPTQLRIAFTLNELKALIADAEATGSEPTALFKPDSFYRSVMFDDLLKSPKRAARKLSPARSEDPIKLDAFIKQLRAAVDEFERVRDLDGYVPRPFYKWFNDFHQDVFAPEEG